MLCEKCHDKDATVHLTQVVDGEVKKLHFCEECAAESGFDIQGPVSITDILLGMGGEEPTAALRASDRVCPSCGMKRADFKKSGRLGCPVCYDTFADELNSLVKAMHRSDQHMGKVPRRESVRARMTAEMGILQKALAEAVAGENFEEAARVRDEIQRCRKQISEEEQKVES